jgi:hypothetical protein
MNWDAVGAVAELAGAVGVVASLIYLATQIRHSNRASAVEAKLVTTGMLTGFIDMFIADPALNDLLMRASTSTEALTDEEYQRFSNMCLKTFWCGSAAHFQLRTGTLTEEDWFEIKAILGFWLAGAGVRSWWRRWGHKRFARQFAEFVDAEVARADNDAAT